MQPTSEHFRTSTPVFPPHPGGLGAKPPGKAIILGNFTAITITQSIENRCTTCVCFFFVIKLESRFKVILMSRSKKLEKLNKLFEDFNLTELVLQRDDIEELLYVLQSAKRQLNSENHHSVVIGFTGDPKANSHVYPELHCRRLKVLVGWETTAINQDYSTIYTAAELEKELVDFNERIRLI